MKLSCCSTWDGNRLLADTLLARLVEDGHPARPGHMLVYPSRHVDRYTDLTLDEMTSVAYLIRAACLLTEAAGYMIAINDGGAAGRRVPHLHVHIIPISESDPLPPGGVRELFFEPGADPWVQ